MRLTPLLVLLVAASLVAPASADAEGHSCGPLAPSDGSCTSGRIDGAAVELVGKDANEHSHGRTSKNGEHPPDLPHSSAPAPAVHHPIPRQDRLAADVDVPCQPGMGSCLDGRHAFLPPAKAPAQPVDPAPVVPAAAGVSLEDVAQFVPRDASMRSQPNGWALVGAPVNLLTDAGPEVVDGTLLGRPAQVRFVPVSFTWDHGDGTTVTVQGPGGSWRDLGQRDFTATSTSHVYGQVGEREVTLSIGYAASYRFDGGGWQQIAGTLPVQVGPVMLRVLEGSTVLVGGVCGSPDAGPGC
jgi:hypothetical protein